MIEMASAILNQMPTPATTLRATMPAELASVIARCLEKTAAARFASMTELQAALERSGGRTARDAAGPSIAVLPFSNLSTDPDSEFFSDGLAEEILNALAQIDGLRVAARASSFSFKGQTIDVQRDRREAARRARPPRQRPARGQPRARDAAAHRRERADSRCGRNATTATSPTSSRFRTRSRGPSPASSKLTLAGDRAQRPARQPTTNVEAYELYMRGRALITKRGKHVAPAMECLKQAVELDPSFAAAWAGLAEAFTVQGYMGMAPPGEVMPKALTAARRAVALDPKSGEAHCALAAALMFWERDYEGARQAFVSGLELNPNYTQGRDWYGLFLLQWLYGAVPEGLAEVRLAYERDPLSAYAPSILALGLAMAGETAEALRFARLAVERDSDAFLYHWIHGLVAHWGGLFDEYFAASDRSAEVSNRHHFVMAHRAIACADCGRHAEARALHEELRTKRAQGYVPLLLARDVRFRHRRYGRRHRIRAAGVRRARTIARDLDAGVSQCSALARGPPIRGRASSPGAAEPVLIQPPGSTSDHRRVSRQEWAHDRQRHEREIRRRPKLLPRCVRRRSGGFPEVSDFGLRPCRLLTARALPGRQPAPTRCR